MPRTEMQPKRPKGARTRAAANCGVYFIRVSARGGVPAGGSPLSLRLPVIDKNSFGIAVVVRAA